MPHSLHVLGPLLFEIMMDLDSEMDVNQVFRDEPEAILSPTFTLVFTFEISVFGN
jgi:hypothetical protein